MKTGVLLVNIGTPLSSTLSDVRKYLIEFLTDSRVIDVPWLKRQLLVRGIIVPFRVRQSAAAYRKIWMEEGSPLIVYGERVRHLLQQRLGDKYLVMLAMRYQQPDIPSVLEQLRKAKVYSIVVLPLFPQYASATTGSVHEKVMRTVQQWQNIPQIIFVNSFYNHPKMITAFAELGRQYHPENVDHVLFSFHGLPQRQILKASVNNYCQLNGKCCQTINANNQFCYSAQCYATARYIADALNITSERYTVCFQSRLGKEPWLQPYTAEVIHQLARGGVKKILVFSPSFICDCLETTFEIGEEYARAFVQAGGEQLQLVEGLNTHPLWIEALEDIVKRCTCLK